MKLIVKKFNDLTVDELYNILKLRVDVFVVEQKCPYFELDGLDQNAVHVRLEDGDGIAAYLRVLDKGVECEYAAIGRVIAAKRGVGMGAKIVREGFKTAKEYFGADTVYVEAQTYAQGFYEKQGFKRVSDEFMIDNIPHIKMLADIKDI